MDFFARERVILASTDVVRIPEYQATVDQHATSAVLVERTPCTSGPVFASWCIEDPLKRVGGSVK